MTTALTGLASFVDAASATDKMGAALPDVMGCVPAHWQTPGVEAALTMSGMLQPNGITPKDQSTQEAGNR